MHCDSVTARDDMSNDGLSAPTTVAPADKKDKLEQLGVAPLSQEKLDSLRDWIRGDPNAPGPDIKGCIWKTEVLGLPEGQQLSWTRRTLLAEDAETETSLEALVAYSNHQWNGGLREGFPDAVLAYVGSHLLQRDRDSLQKIFDKNPVIKELAPYLVPLHAEFTRRSAVLLESGGGSHFCADMLLYLKGPINFANVHYGQIQGTLYNGQSDVVKEWGRAPVAKICGSFCKAFSGGSTAMQNLWVSMSFGEGLTNTSSRFSVASQETVEKLTERGRFYLKCVRRPEHISYDGNLLVTGALDYYFLPASGRAMLDIAGFCRWNPNSDEYASRRRHGSRGYGDDDDSSLAAHALWLLPPYFPGYSFACKRWGQLAAAHAKPVVYRDDAIDKLVLPNVFKTHAVRLVRGSRTAKLGDLVEGKASGNLFLFAGPPGTGKTSMAEAMAEKLHVPCYYVGASELGTTNGEFEDRINEILETGESWDAVVLIDEAEALVSQRTPTGDRERVAIVGRFLAVLDRFRGTMVLTTNLKCMLDDALVSRVTCYYEFKDVPDPAKLWGVLLSRNGLSLPEADIQHLLEKTSGCDGRTLKNVIQNAIKACQGASGSADAKPTLVDFLGVLPFMRIKRTAQVDLLEGLPTGFFGGPRSVFSSKEPGEVIFNEGGKLHDKMYPFWFGAHQPAAVPPPSFGQAVALPSTHAGFDIPPHVDVAVAD